LVVKDKISFNDGARQQIEEVFINHKSSKGDENASFLPLYLPIHIYV
jgi:hypothetical protein